MDHTAQGSIQVKGLEKGTAKAELHTTPHTLETRENQAADNTQMLITRKTKSGIFGVGWGRCLWNYESLGRNF